MKRKSLYMGTTKIGPQQTVGEIISELVKADAISVNTDYKGGKIIGLRWIMLVDGNAVLFDMPVRIEPVFKAMGQHDKDQAERVAWRQLLRWVQAQNAMIDTGMVTPAEVYFAYSVHAPTGKTLFQFAVESKFKLLGPAAQD